MGPDHRSLVCKNGEYIPRNISGSAGLLHEVVTPHA